MTHKEILDRIEFSVWICFLAWVAHGHYKIHKRVKKLRMEHNQIHLDPVREQAQKEYRQQKELFKSAIKDAVKNQKEYKKNWQQSLAAINGFDLRCMYIAYALFRRNYGGYTKLPEAGISVERTGSCSPERVVSIKSDRPISFDYIESLIQKYVPKTVYSG